MKFEKGTFITSALEENEFPRLKLPNGKFMPEIVMTGRSNVGKSSLINSLLRSKNLAKTSSVPGKTQRINFFSIDDQALLVDLPGYGYSKAPKEAAEHWSRAIDIYLNKKTLQLIVLLMDIRREPSDDDLAMARWATMNKVPFITVFTKSDKVSNVKLLEIPNSAGTMSFTNTGFNERAKLIALINKVMKWD